MQALSSTKSLTSAQLGKAYKKLENKLSEVLGWNGHEKRDGREEV